MFRQPTTKRPEEDTMPRTLYTVDQAAERLNTTARFVRRLIAERRIAFVRLVLQG
jgi:hypothetical protein